VYLVGCSVIWLVDWLVGL